MISTRYTSEDAHRFAKYGDTAEGVPFDYWLCGAAGAGFCLVPTRGVHTDEQVGRARAKLKRDRDVVGRIETFWIEP
jgi:hypothetical protein